MLSLKEAQKKVLQSTADLKEKKVSLPNSLNAIIAEDIFSNIDSPTEDISLIDGYGLRAEDVIGADENYPVKLSLLKVGDGMILSITPGYCIKIKAGESIPEGVTSIANSAETDCDGRDVFIFREYQVGQNIKKKGSDLKIDDLIIPKGKTISSKEALLLSILGKEKIKVYKRPRTAVVAMLEDNKKKIVENMLTAKAIECRAESAMIELSDGDKLERMLKEFIKKGSEKFDILSLVPRNQEQKHLVVKIFESMDAKTIFTDINQFPAQDITFLQYKGMMIFVLPASFFEIDIYFEMFLKPIIQKMTGSTEMFSNVLWARPLEEIVHQKGKTFFFRVKIEKKSKEYYIKVIESDEDNIYSILSTDGIAIITEDEAHIGLDSRLKVYLV